MCFLVDNVVEIYIPDSSVIFKSYQDLYVVLFQSFIRIIDPFMSML